MRSRSKPALALVCLLIAGFALASFRSLPAWSAEVAVEAGRAIKEDDVIRALEQLKKDPNFAAERKIKMLRWLRKDQAPREPSNSLEWLAELFNWLAQNGRFLFWGALAA